MRTTIRNPNIQVLLHKVVTRTSVSGNAASATTGSGAPVGYSGSGQTNQATQPPPSQNASQRNVYDITGRLGEGSAVRVRKSVREPAGAFSITFVDRYVSELHDSIYTLIEPMDLLEIRFAGDAYQYVGSQTAKRQGGSSPGQLPIIMRGFVSDVTRDQTMGSDGKPRRSIHVTGHDYQKILQLIQIFNMPATPDVVNLITQFPLFSQYGPELNVQNSTAFINQIFSLIVNPYIANLQRAGATSGVALSQVTTDIQVPDALVSVQLGAFNSGNIQQLLEEYLDIGPFNEFFVEDRDAGVWGPAGPYAVYRPMPFLSAAQRAPIQPIQTSKTTSVAPNSPAAPNANVVAIETNSIVSISARRTDANVANYFWCDAPRFNMNYDDVTKMYATYAAQHGEPPFYVTNYGNVNPLLYGLRKMEVATQQGGAYETNAGNGSPAGDERWKNQVDFLSWIDNRRNLLIALNQDNVIFETGAMHLRGNEQIKAGVYVQVNYGNSVKSLYYAHSVTQVFEPFGNYFTEVEFDRGTNFIDRITSTHSNAAPYFAEMLIPGDQ